MKAKVAVLRTTPDHVVGDYGRLMRMADYKQFCPEGHDTLIKINISWHHYYPACSSAPWQYDGVVSALREDGRPASSIIPAHNRTVVVDDKVGMVNNHLNSVDKKHGLTPVHLYEPPVKWVEYRPKGRFRVLQDVFPRRREDPRALQLAEISFTCRR